MDWELLADQPLGQKLIKKGGWLYFFMMISAPLGYFTKLIISNTLSVEDVGIFYSVLWLVLLLSSYNDLWLTEALQYFIPKYRIEKQYGKYKTIVIFTLIAQLISWIIIWGTLYFSAWWLAQNHFHSLLAVDTIRILARYFIGINFIQALYAIFYAFQDTFSQWIIEFTRMFTIFWFTLIFRLTKTINLQNFSIIRIIGLSLSAIICIIIFLKKYGKTFKLGKREFSKNLLKKQIKYAFWIFLWANVWTLFIQVDQQLIVNLLWAKPAGYYTNYISLISIFTIVASPLLALIFPITTELITKKDTEKLGSLKNLLYKYGILFALSISWILMVFWQEIATIFFTTKFLISGQLVRYIAPLLVFNLLFLINFGFLAGLGKVKQRVKIVAIGFIANLVSNILLLWVFKIWLIGGVISMWLGRMILRYLSFRIINQHQKIEIDRKFLIKNISILAWMSIILRIIKDKFFILNDSYHQRFVNIGYMTGVVVIYYGIVAICNYKNIQYLIWEIKSLRKK